MFVNQLLEEFSLIPMRNVCFELIHWQPLNYFALFTNTGVYEQARVFTNTDVYEQAQVFTNTCVYEH